VYIVIINYVYKIDTSNTKCNDLDDKTVNRSSYRRVYDLYIDDKIQIINTDLQVRLCGKSCWMSTSYNNYIIRLSLSTPLE